MTDIEEAILIAFEAHKDDKYGDDKPYMRHLNDVYNVACSFQMPENMKIAAWLHDIKEDHPDKEYLVAECFSREIWLLMDAVTDEPAGSRVMRKILTFPKTAKSPEAVALKLCDLISNVTRSIQQNNDRKLIMYLHDHQLVVDSFLPVVKENPHLLGAVWDWYKGTIFQAKHLMNHENSY